MDESAAGEKVHIKASVTDGRRREMIRQRGSEVVCHRASRRAAEIRGNVKPEAATHAAPPTRRGLPLPHMHSL